MIFAFAPQVEAAPVTVLPPLNEAVLAYCRARVGKQVGDGQCADLPQQALLSLKAMPRVKDAPNEGDYVWGRLVATLTPKTITQAALVMPGDILQYRDVVFEHRTRSSWSRSGAAHHTSIVAAVKPGAIAVYEQNVNGRMTVGKTDLALGDLKSGTLWVYRAQPVPPRTSSRG